MDKFLEMCNLPKMNQEEAENLNSPIVTTKIEAVIKKNYQHTKSPGPDGFTGKFWLLFVETTEGNIV